MATATQPLERIKDIDIIRGFALCGILLVNMFLFKAPLFQQLLPPDYPAGVDRVAAWLIQILVRAKFYAVFSFLFGLGFYLFMQRLLTRDLPAGALYRRPAIINPSSTDRYTDAITVHDKPGIFNGIIA